MLGDHPTAVSAQFVRAAPANPDGLVEVDAIAAALFISPQTVRKHLENVFEKLDVRTRTAAAAYARSAFTSWIGD